MRHSPEIIISVLLLLILYVACNHGKGFQMKTITESLDDNFAASKFEGETFIEKLAAAEQACDHALERAVKAGFAAGKHTMKDDEGKSVGYTLRVKFNKKVCENEDDLGEFDIDVLLAGFNSGYDLLRRREVRESYKDSPAARKVKADIERMGKQAKILANPTSPLFAELLSKMQVATTSEGVKDLQEWLDKVEVA